MQDYEVILVDSGSTDGTLNIARANGVDEIVYIKPENFSFGRALNYGCEAASGTYCIIASAHVYPKRDDWLETLLRKFSDHNVGLVYGKQRGNAITTFSEKQIFKQWFPAYDIDHQTHPFCNNANTAIRRELWKEYPYDEKLTGLEDVAWAKQIQKAGYEISYDSKAEVVHVHDETAREVYNRYRREAYAHRQVIPNHYFSFLDFLRLSSSHILSDYSAALDENTLWENLFDIPKFRLLQFWGTYRGFTQEGPISEELWQRFYYPNRDSYPEGSQERFHPNRANVEVSASKDVDVEESGDNEIDYTDSSDLTEVPSETTT